MITEDAIMTSIAKAMQDQIDREIIESLGLKFRLGRYLGENAVWADGGNSTVQKKPHYLH